MTASPSAKIISHHIGVHGGYRHHLGKHVVPQVYFCGLVIGPQWGLAQVRQGQNVVVVGNQSIEVKVVGRCM